MRRLSNTGQTFIILSIFACMMLTTLHAHAQSKPPKIEDLTDAQRDKLIQKLDRARILYEEKLYKRALKSLTEAYGLFPHPDVLYRIAECEEKLGRQSDALQHYEQVLQQTTKEADKSKLSTKIAALKQALEQQKTKLAVNTIPSGATFIIEGDTHGPTPKEISLKPGKYAVRVIKKGYETQTQQVLISRGEQTTINVTLKKRVVTQDDPPTRQSPVPMTTWVLGGVGILSTISASLFWVLYSDASSDVANYDIQKDRIARPADYDQRVSDRNTYGTVAIVSTGAAALSLAGALIAWYIHDPEDAPPSSRAMLLPWVQPNAAGLGFTTSF